MKVTDEMLDRAVEVYRPSYDDRRTTAEAMRDALEAVLDAHPVIKAAIRYAHSGNQGYPEIGIASDQLIWAVKEAGL